MQRLLSRAAILVTAVGCGSSEPSEDSSHCQQTYEFGNTGCGELTGLVTDEGGQPIAGAYVSVQGAVDPARELTLDYGYVQTGASGAYRLRVIRMTGEAPSDRPDTITVWVRAAMPPSPSLPVGTPGPMDSVRASLEIRPVGERPVVTQVASITIPGS
jgi:hypothetical protein